ncbi:MAG: DUF1987 domain-containing protein [Leptolyngbya sp. SIO3F4]|nr:DUF1987 domain-containing protein [Leptolyngbya sp. SIO3F4]
MKNLSLEKTLKTPYIHFDAVNGHLLMEGRSIPEDAYMFYQPIYQWLEQYVLENEKKTIIEFKLEYFNTSSSKCILEVLHILEKINDKQPVEVKWFYDEDDEDMYESGENYSQIIELAIKFETY